MLQDQLARDAPSDQLPHQAEAPERRIHLPQDFHTLARQLQRSGYGLSVLEPVDDDELGRQAGQGQQPRPDFFRVARHNQVHSPPLVAADPHGIA